MTNQHTIEIPIQGMDCSECTLHVQKAIADLPGVESVDVFLSSEKAIIQLDPAKVDLPAIRKAVESAGYSIPESATKQQSTTSTLNDFTRRILVSLHDLRKAGTVLKIGHGRGVVWRLKDAVEAL